MDMNGSNEKGMENNASSGSGIPVDWQFSSSAYSCPPVPMMDSFAAASLWASSSSQNMVLSEDNAGPAAAAMQVPRGGGFLPPMPGFLPPGLTHFPVDSGFIERAARSSCFGGASLGSMVNAFSAADSLNPFSNSSEGFLDHHQKEISGSNDRGSASRSLEEQRAEPELAGDDHEEAPNVEAAAGDCSSKASDSKKRRRPNEVIGTNQVQSSNLPADSANESVHSKEKGEEISPTTTGKSKGKQAKENLEAEKEEYIHVRARRGQATNSHSLAERLRREKISERMKLLQDLVPGCSKVTGKAVMLDEIINYVQSLQRQVEFLSMKLATVNPRIDLNIEGLLSKDLLRFPGVPSSSIGFSPEMLHPQLHLAQPGLLPGGVPGMATPSDVFRRAIQAQLNAKDGHREPTSQMPSNTLDGAFHDIAQMAYPSLGSQDLNIRSSRDGFLM